MPNSIAGSATSQPLQRILAQRGALPPKIGLAIFRQLLRQARVLHAGGAAHLAIGPETVLLDATGRAALAAADPVRELDRTDSDCCPPELHGTGVVRLPVGIEAAQQELLRVGVVLDPRRIDVYQLGVLLCRILTSEAASAYLSSPKISSKVPAALRPLIERALGHCAADRFADCDAYAAALEALNREAPATAPETPPAGSAVVSSPKTPTERVDLPDEDPPLTRLGHYRVDKRIGRGGMGDVYRGGHEESLQRPVAIKVLPAELARDEDFVRRFRAEAAAAAQLAHPNIVPVYFIGRDAGVHFFVMQYVEGESLDRLLTRKGPLGVEEAVGILEQCLAGLGAAHRAGLIHRDVKPGNILLDGQTGRALVADFGLVKTIGAGGGMTATGVVLGTVDYIAPEQARGRDVDGRADLYALGVLTYQMLSGRLPFRAETPSAMIFQHAYETPTPLLEVAPETPRPLAAVVDKLMAKDPASRYQTCEEVLADFRRWRAGQPVQADQPQAPAEESGEILTIVDLEEPPVLPFPVEKGGRWQRFRDRMMDWFQARAPALVNRLQNTEQQVDAAVADYQRRRDRLASLIDEAEETAVALEEQAKSHRAAASSAGRRANGAAERAECERVAGDLESQAAEQREQLAQMRAQLVKVDATLSRLRSQSELLQGRLRVAAARLRMEEGLVRPPRPVRRLLLAVGAGLALALLVLCCVVFALRSWPTVAPAPISPAKGESVLVESPQKPPPSFVNAGNPQQPHDIAGPLIQPGMLALSPTEVVTAAAFSSAGKRLVLGGTKLHLWDLGRNQEIHDFGGRTYSTIRTVVWSPDGRRVLMGGSETKGGQTSGVAVLFEADTGQVVMTFNGHPTPVGAVAFSSDGRQILTAGGDVVRKILGAGSTSRNVYQDTDLRRWDVATGNELSRYQGPKAPTHSITFTTDGKRVLAAGSVEDTALYSWDIAAPTGLRIGFPNGLNPTYAVLLPGGAKLAYLCTDWSFRTYNLTEDHQGLIAEEMQAVRPERLTVWPEMPAWSRDGRFLVCSTMKYAKVPGKAPIYIVDAATDQLVHTLEGHPLRVKTLAISDDGRYVFSSSTDGNRLWDASSPDAGSQPAVIVPEVKPSPPVRAVELFEAYRRVNEAVVKLKANPGDLGAIQALVEAVKDPDANLRRTAAEALLQLRPHPKAASPGYAALLGADYPLDMRLRAAEAHWEVDRNGPAVLPVLIEGVRNIPLRQRALTIMARLGPEAKGALPELTPLLQSGGLPSVLNDVFSDIGPDAVAPLMEMLTRKGVAGGQAQNMLGSMGADAAPALLKLLADPDALVRSGVIITLGRVAPCAPEVMPALMEVAQKGNANLRQDALTALGIAGPSAKAAVPILLDAVKSNDPIQRHTALQALFNIRLDPTALPALNEAVNDNRPYDRILALELRWRVDRQTAAAVAGLTSAITGNPHDRTACQTALAALDRIAAEDKSAAHALAESLKSVDAPTRSRAALLLASLGVEAETVTPLLVADVKSPFVGADMKAADALGLYGKAASAAVPALQGLLKDNPWPYIATKAAEALYRIDPSQKAAATEALLDVIYKRLFPAEKYAAAAALCRMDPSNAKAVAVLKEGLLDPNPDTRVSALTWCARAGAGCRELLPLVERSLGEEADLGRVQAATALWRVGGTDQATNKAIAALLLSLKEPTYAAVRGQAAEHLGEMGASAKAAAPALTAALRDRSTVVRSSAADALRMVDPEAAANAGVP